MRVIEDMAVTTDRRSLNPPRILALGFGLLILFGAFLLTLPLATQTGERVRFIDALFTSTSAVCVTGLVVKNTASTWSDFGHFVIISLIQMGGLGFMTMATLVAIMGGKKITLKDRLVIKEQLNEESLSGLVRLVKYVVLSTFTIEFIGALILSTRFIGQYGLGKGIWFSVFHSISAFCNAGFDLIGNSLEGYSLDPVVTLTVAFLVIIGGLGFSVYMDLTKTKRISRLKLHTKMAILMTGILLFAGTLGIMVLEYKNPETLKGMGFFEKLMAAFFQSAVARTAGFNSINLAAMKESTVFILIILMFIGGSPGSTAGGIKTTTFGVVIATTIAVIKGDKDVILLKRRINEDVIKRALALFVIGVTFISFVTLALSFTEEASFMDLLYETTSAFATVGVTRGITPNLTDFGKILLCFTMYAGRLGPLTMGYALLKDREKKHFRYGEGNITIG